MKRKFVSCFLIIAMLMSLFVVNTSANNDISIYVNEQALQCDVTPYIENGRTMVPMRKIFEALNANVDWDDATQTITATKEDAVITLQINNSTLYNNGIAETLDVPPIIVNNSTFVPIRAVSQSLNASVDWFGYTQTVYINSPTMYTNEYDTYVESFMQGAVPAGYECIENFSSGATVNNDTCLQGLVTDVQLKENDVYLIVENQYAKSEKVAVYICEQESTDIEKLAEVFNGNHVSIGGRYLGVTKAFNTAALSLQYINVFENNGSYNQAELTYPKLSQLDETVVLYDLSNQPQTIHATQASEYLGAGWTTEAKVIMYASDGRTIDVLQSEIENYKNVGWYLEPVTLMYAADGRTMYVANSEVEAYQSVGWYNNPVTTVYAPDGRTMLIYEHELYDYLNVGWYATYDEAQASIKPTNSSNNNYEPNYDNQPNSGGSTVYRTPSGKRYHFDPNCGGKNSYQTTLEQAKNAGLTPCEKCAW